MVYNQELPLSARRSVCLFVYLHLLLFFFFICRSFSSSFLHGAPSMEPPVSKQAVAWRKKSSYNRKQWVLLLLLFINMPRPQIQDFSFCSEALRHTHSGITTLTEGRLVAQWLDRARLLYYVLHHYYDAYYKYYYYYYYYEFHYSGWKASHFWRLAFLLRLGDPSFFWE